MDRALLIRLEGPLMAFGDVAIDARGPTAAFPTLSMMTGLLGNALGLDHRDRAALQRLQDRLILASRRDRKGELIVDYQTVAYAKDDKVWTTRGEPAGRLGGEVRGPIQRWRHYWADAAFTCAVALTPVAGDGDDLSLERLAEALDRPARPVFLGRKGCFPAEPLRGDIVEASSLRQALLHGQKPGKRIEAQFPADMAGSDLWLDAAIQRRRRILHDRRDWLRNAMAGERAVDEVTLAVPEN